MIVQTNEWFAFLSPPLFSSSELAVHQQENKINLALFVMVLISWQVGTKDTLR